MGDDALDAAAADDAHNDVVDHQRLGRHWQTNVSPHRSGHDPKCLCPLSIPPFFTYPFYNCTAAPPESRWQSFFWPRKKT